ncbi:MAG: hypothetical protein ACTHYN_00940 [Marinobacter sp.]|uniref:hypothetical protein n=1 Tax=Marinobacter sp. TaxID=50741 RepID=UPI00264F46BE|nr:hypothetical protein [Marinobacter sp.]
MLDKYGAGNDSYCYENSDVLVNLLNIRDGELLHAAERDISNVNADTIEFCSPPYDLDYLKAIHRVAAEDRSWASVAGYQPAIAWFPLIWK